MKRRTIYTALAGACLALAACSGPPAKTAAELDKDSSPLANCGYDAVNKATSDIEAVSQEDAEHLCSYLQADNSGPAPISQLRALAKGVVVLQDGYAHLDKVPAPKLAKAMIDAADARGQTGQPNKQMDTYSVLTAMASTTGGDVSPMAVTAFLQSAGPSAHTMSDDGLINMTGPIHREVKRSGQDLAQAG